MLEKLEGFQSLDLSCCKSMLVFYKGGNIVHINDSFVPCGSDVVYVIFLKDILDSEEADSLVSVIKRMNSTLKEVFPLLLQSLSKK